MGRVTLAGGVAEVALVHLVKLLCGGEMHRLDDAAYAFAVANPPLDFVQPRVVDGLVDRRARDLREAQLRQSPRASKMGSYVIGREVFHAVRGNEFERDVHKVRGGH